MQRKLVLGLIICFINLVQTMNTPLVPRGPRPSTTAQQKSSSCSETKWAICTDSDWGPKCPSGCRMQGLIDVKNQQNDEQIKDIRQMLDDYSKMFGSTHITVTEAINRIKQSLDGLGKFGDTYYQQVNQLNSRLIILQTKINEQIYKINVLRQSILEQYKDITRLEVDIDIKIRACRGSCSKSFIYNINRERNAQLKKNLEHLISSGIRSSVYGKPTHAFKMRQLKDNPNSHFKSRTTDEKYPFFWDAISMREYTLETNKEDSSVSETKHLIAYNQTVSATPHSDVKIPTSATHVGSISRGDGHFQEGHIDESSYFGHSSFDKMHSSHESIITETTISKDGTVTKTVTSGVPDSFSTSFQHFFDELGIPSHAKGKGSATSTSIIHLPETERLRTSHTKSTSKTGGKVTHRKTVTVTSQSGDFSNLGDFSDFSSDPSVGMEGLSSSTKKTTITQWSSNSRPKGFTVSHGVNVSDLLIGENRDHHASGQMR
ncbi:fibrinogen alpha chain-like [Hypanus sabinus]|uniref:fibrinogen alpha chain-like n=1 Tax=Hypanus sabinus TaxID=79690 RepID=UPI0028C414D7|nr:fibrinogen alpha chain-like [Hypanus sabinus]